MNEVSSSIPSSVVTLSFFGGEKKYFPERILKTFLIELKKLKNEVVVIVGIPSS